MSLDAIAYAVNVQNQGSNLVGDHATGAGSLVLDSVYNFPETGSLDINGDVYTYTAVDELTNTVTLSGVTTADYADDDRVELSPASPVWYATVVVGSDQPGFNAMVPIHLVPFLTEDAGGALFTDGIPIQIESINAGEYQWQVVAAPGRQPQYNAINSPIVVTNAAGESATVTADGFLTSTNDPVPVRAIAGKFNTMTASDDYVFGGSSAGTTVQKFDASDGSEVGGGWPVTVTHSSLAADGGYVYAMNSGVSIRKFAIADGVEVVAGGWPKAIGTGVSIFAAGGFVYLTDASTVLRKYAASNGVEDTTADWPISADLRRPAISGGYVYAADVSSGAIRKFDDATGTEDTSGAFPLAGSYGNIAADDTYLYAPTPNSPIPTSIDKIDLATGEVLAASGFPLAIGSTTVIAVDGDFLYVNDRTFGAIRQFNRVAGYQSTNRNSSDGSDLVRKITVSDLTADGISTLNGPTFADYLAVTWTKARKTATQSTATGTGETMGQSGETYGAYDGSGTNGDTAFWTESNGVFTILEDGVYDLESYVQWASNATGYRILTINVSSVPTTTIGSADIRPAVNGQVTRQNASCRVALSAGDTVSVAVQQTSGGNLDVSIGSYLSISRVGALAA